MTPEDDEVRVTVDGMIGRITLNRPAKLNALSRVALQRLIDAAAELDQRSEVSVVVISGEGRAFSAGFDLHDRTWADIGPPERSAVTGRAMAEAIGGMSAVTIASIRGHCIGGGVVLASACDLRVASTTARFRIPEVDLGIPLYWTGIPRLVREIGPALTKELVMTGRPFDAHEAQAIRFVNRVVDEDALEAEVAALARELASKRRHVLRTTKQQVEAVAPAVPPTDRGSEADAAAFATALGGGDDGGPRPPFTGARN